MQGDDVTACPAGRHRRCGRGVGGLWGHWGPRLESQSRAEEAAWSSAPWPECFGKFRATAKPLSRVWSQPAVGDCVGSGNWPLSPSHIHIFQKESRKPLSSSLLKVS